MLQRIEPGLCRFERQLRGVDRVLRALQIRRRRILQLLQLQIRGIDRRLRRVDAVLRRLNVSRRRILKCEEFGLSRL